MEQSIKVIYSRGAYEVVINFQGGKPSAEDINSAIARADLGYERWLKRSEAKETLDVAVSKAEEVVEAVAEEAS